MGKVDSNQHCPYCDEYFTLYIESYPSKIDDKRESYFVCPYCNQLVGKIFLQGNEEVESYKL